MVAEDVLKVEGLEKTYGRRKVVDGVGFRVGPGEIVGLLGPNGAGKSTSFRMTCGIVIPDRGKVTVGGLDVTTWPMFRRAKEGHIGYLPQEPSIFRKLTVEQNISSMLELLGVERKRRRDRTEELLDQFDITHIRKSRAGKLSGGERRRVALCKLLIQQPDLLLLDEPTNHLDAEAVNWLEQHLAKYPGTVVAVTHDRYFLDNVAQWILELDRGSGFPFEGNYTSWLEQKQKRLLIEQKSSQARQKTLEKELEWIRMSPRARQSKSKARISAYEQLASQQFEERPDELEIQIPPGKHLGEVVVHAEGLTKSYNDRVLIDNLSFRLPAGGIVGVIGPNGAGKTTLFRMITGQDKPDGGTLRIGDTVELGYVDQSRDSLTPTNSLYQEISGGLDFLEAGGKRMNSRAYVSKFNFKGTDQEKKVGDLSGGERNRVHLAKLLRRGCNVLLLDEPTNDLDVDTLRALEEAILSFVGCVVVITHDRWFLDRIATHILAFEGDGYVHWCEGNFQTYEQQRRERLGIHNDEPKRFRYKKLAT